MLTELCVVQFQSVITLMIKQMHDYITIIYFVFFFFFLILIFLSQELEIII